MIEVLTVIDDDLIRSYHTYHLVVSKQSTSASGAPTVWSNISMGNRQIWNGMWTKSVKL